MGAFLQAMGKLKNTLIIYSSDHGSYRPDRNGGLKGAKGSNFQGGLRSPGIFFWPDGKNVLMVFLNSLGHKLSIPHG